MKRLQYALYASHCQQYKALPYIPYLNACLLKLSVQASRLTIHRSLYYFSYFILESIAVVVGAGDNGGNFVCFAQKSSEIACRCIILALLLVFSRSEVWQT